jgi:FolB domain-containing protein
MEHQPADRIHIEQLEIWTRIGVSEAERKKSQRLALNLTLWLFPPIDDLNDDIRKTADYSSVCQETKEFLENREHRLIETIADHLAVFLLKRFPVHKVEVEVRKFVLPNAAYASVMVTRTAALD